MKKIFTILLTALFLFNLAGYRLLFSYMQQQADSRLEAAFDQQEYNEKDLVMIKIPLSLPYMTDQQNFERVNGEITFQGKILKYVKRKISGGDLILMCMPYFQKMQIASAKDDFYKFSNDLVQNNHSKKTTDSTPGFFKNLAVEYDVFATAYSLAPQDIITASWTDATVNFLSNSYHALPDQPPEIITLI